MAAKPAIGEFIYGSIGEPLGIYIGDDTALSVSGLKVNIKDLPMGVKASPPSALDQWKRVDFMAEFNPDKGRESFEDVAKRAQKEIMKDDRWKKMKSGSSFSDEVNLRSSRAPDCCLCRKPVKIYCRNDYQRDGYEVTFECHGRREVTFVGTEQTKFRGISLEEFISNMNPFVSDFKRLNITEEPPKQKPKPRTGLTITIGQERVINLE